MVRVGLLLNCVLVLLATGCRTPDHSVLLLERELRLKDCEIFELEEMLEEYESRLDSCRRENVTLRRKQTADDRTSGSDRDDAERPGGRLRSLLKKDKSSPAGSDSGDAETITPDLAKPPQIDLGQETTPDQLDAKPSPSPDDAAPPLNKPQPEKPQPEKPLPEKPLPDRTPPDIDLPEPPPGVEAPAKKSLPEKSPAGDQSRRPRGRQVSDLRINPRFSGGTNTDGLPGDEGVMLVLEVHDAAGRLVDEPGPVEIEVIDLGARGDDAIVAQWSFTASETARLFRNSRLGSGYYFELPWPGEPPLRENLKFRVRYESPDERQLQADHKFQTEVLPRIAHRPRRTAPRIVESAPAVAPQPTISRTADRPTWRPVR